MSISPLMSYLTVGEWVATLIATPTKESAARIYQTIPKLNYYSDISPDGRRTRRCT